MEENKTVKHYMTQEGYDKKQKDLEWRKVQYRKEIAEKLKEARAQGDLSENAEYDAAKDEQRDNEAMIAQLEEELSTAEIRKERVVKLLDVELNEELNYVIVGTAEADVLNDKISNESPLGAAIENHHTGDTVVVDAPAGQIAYKILADSNDGNE